MTSFERAIIVTLEIPHLSMFQLNYRLLGKSVLKQYFQK